MGDTIARLTAPTIKLTGNRILSNGTRSGVTDLVIDQRTPNGSPASVTNTDVVMFVGSVTIKLESSYSLKDYSAAPTEVDGKVTGMKQGTQATGNLLYFFGPKMPAPSEAKVYTGSFKVVKPGVSFSGKGYVFADDVVTLFAAVFINGEVSIEAVAKIKIV